LAVKCNFSEILLHYYLLVTSGWYADSWSPADVIINFPLDYAIANCHTYSVHASLDGAPGWFMFSAQLVIREYTLAAVHV